jgi:RNA polymerase sigma-70 factor (TIGR02960 family)
MTAELLDKARAGDGHAFAQLTDPYRRELHVHCYRVLGSAQDAEDALQETLLSAWRGLGNFEERSTLRTWLYSIATSRCLDALRSASRRPQMDAPIFAYNPPEPTRMSEVVWLEPYPDLLLEGLTDPAPGPESRYEAREAISLAFVTALQLLPPRQRVVLVLRDVLGFRASEVARMLETTEESVTSALKRARLALKRRMAESEGHEPAPAANSPVEHELVERLTRAYESDDLDGLVALLSDDVWLRMPPIPLEYQGREVVRQFFAILSFGKGRSYRLVPTRANGQPAVGVYLFDSNADVFHAMGLIVLTLAGRQIREMTRFDNGVLPWFGLPRSLPGF